MIFENRHEAGRQLSERLRHLRDKDTVVLALLRGGVPLGYEVAMALNAPLDVVFVRKIGAPGNHELAIGAIVDGKSPKIVVNEGIARRFGLSRKYIEAEADKELKEIERRRKLYLKGLKRTSVKGKTAIIVDDGIATGSTMQAAVKGVRRWGTASIVIAVPVSSVDALEQLQGECDEVVCLSAPEMFGAVGYFYADFTQVEDDEVVELLQKANRRIGTISPAKPAPNRR